MLSYRSRLVLAGAGIFLLTLLTYMPADRVLNLFRDDIPVNIQWQQVSGPVLHPVFYNLNLSLSGQRSVLIESADVRISILPLLLGRLRLEFALRPDEGDIRGVAVLTLRGWQVPQIEGKLPVQALSTLLPELQMTGSTGRISFTGNSVVSTYRSLPVTGDLKMSIEELQLDMLNAGRPLGSYSLLLQASDDAGIHGNIKTMSTDAQLSVEGQLGLDPATSTLRFEGQGWTAASAPESIRSVLPLLGPVVNDRAHIKWQTSL